MSKRSNNSAGTVSLFPFLAVLVCAMGALILLLLVTTRRIRQQTLAQQTIVQPVNVEPTHVEPKSSPAIASPPPMPMTILEQAVPDPADEPLLPLLAADPPPPTPAPYDPNPELRQRLAELESQQAALATDVAAKQRQLSELEATVTAKSQSLTNLEGEAESITTEKQRLNNLYIKLRQEKQDTEQRADELRTDVERAREQLANADSKFAIVPYEGNNGTRRRPIIIECTADRLTFASEGVSLKATDFEGFRTRFNPLIYATQALIRYWDRIDRTAGSEGVGEPYVLLVVRPGGTTAYYLARGMLAGLKDGFGYELVTDDQEFVWPESSPEAILICKTIIDKMLAERNDLMDVALRSGANLHSFHDTQGRFQLEEFEQLRNPTRQLTINGQNFSRGSSYGSGYGRDSQRRFNNASGRTPSGTDSPWTGQSGNNELVFAELTPLPGEEKSTMSRGERTTNSSDNVSGRPGTEGVSGETQGNGLFDDPGRNAVDIGSGPTSVGSSSTSGDVHTRQNSAITRDDRMPEWLRDGTIRPPQPTGESGTVGDPFTDGSTTDPPAAERSGVVDALHRNPTDPERFEMPAPPMSPGQGKAFDRLGDAKDRPATGPRQPATKMLTMTPDRSQGGSGGDPLRPSWGIRSGNGNIGYEREVRIRVSPSQITIGDDNAFQLDPSLSVSNTKRLMVAAMNREVRNWGDAPKSFYWVPSVRFMVAPGGVANHLRLRSIVHEWDLRTTVEYTSESK